MAVLFLVLNQLSSISGARSSAGPWSCNPDAGHRRRDRCHIWGAKECAAPALPSRSRWGEKIKVSEMLFLLHLFFSQKYLLIYLFIWKVESQRERDLPSTDSLSQYPPKPRTDEAKGRNSKGWQRFNSYSCHLWAWAGSWHEGSLGKPRHSMTTQRYPWHWSNWGTKLLIVHMLAKLLNEWPRFVRRWHIYFPCVEAQVCNGHCCYKVFSLLSTWMNAPSVFQLSAYMSIMILLTARKLMGQLEFH